MGAGAGGISILLCPAVSIPGGGTEIPPLLWRGHKNKLLIQCNGGIEKMQSEALHRSSSTDRGSPRNPNTRAGGVLPGNRGE